MSSEIFSLKWNEFQKNIANTFQDLWQEAQFSDVTLVCEEDQEIEAHLIILTSCSPFFSKILKMSQQSHPIIYMMGLKAKELLAIGQFHVKVQ